MSENLNYISYWAWVRAEAAIIGSDGCTLVSELYRKCCLQHDIAYYYAKDPTDAYQNYINGQKDYWENATNFSKEQADAQFRECMRQISVLNGASPIAFIRWLGVKVLGKWAWEKHRKAGHGTFAEAG